MIKKQFRRTDANRAYGLLKGTVILLIQILKTIVIVCAECLLQLPDILYSAFPDLVCNSLFS